MNKAKANKRQILHLETRISIPKAQSEGVEAIKSMLKKLKDEKKLSIGINSVNRSMTQKKVKMLVVASDINPLELIQHLLIMAEAMKVHIIFPQIKQKEMGESLGLRVASVVGINDDVSSDILDMLIPFATLLSPGPLQTIRIETDFSLQGKAK